MNSPYEENINIKSYCFLFIKLINILLILLGIIYKNSPDEKGIKTAICLISKQENRYIKEFVDYYKKLNINKIFLYDNNDINGEHFEGILSKYIKLDFVEIVNYRGKYIIYIMFQSPCKKGLLNHFILIII